MAYGLLVVWCAAAAAASSGQIPCRYQSQATHFESKAACEAAADEWIRDELPGVSDDRGIYSINVVCAEFIGYGESES